MADLEKQLADLENDMNASEKPTVSAAVANAPVAAPIVITATGGKQIQQAIAAPATRGIPTYFWGILAAVPLVIIAVLYFVKPKLVYRKKKFVIQDFVKLTALITIGLWVLIAVIMYFGGYISMR